MSVKLSPAMTKDQLDAVVLDALGIASNPIGVEKIFEHSKSSVGWGIVEPGLAFERSHTILGLRE
eukprot:2200820-Prymnesium_polylepis.2